MHFKKLERHSLKSSNQKGSIFLSYLFALGLCFSFLLITWKGVEYMQYKIAAQSRLDICAVKIIQSRKNTLKTLTNSNQVIRTTVIGIYIARGLQIAGGVAGKILGTVGEKALIQMNQSAALYQNTILIKETIQEFNNGNCSPTPYSKEPSFCVFRPLQSQLIREKARFPDIQGALIFRAKEKTLLHVNCFLGLKISTKMQIRGDPFLKANQFQEIYEK